MHVLRGLLQSLVMLAISAAVGAVAASVCVTVDGGGLRVPFALVLMVVGGAPRPQKFDPGNRGERAVRALLGLEPERDESGADDAPTALGVFLFVSMPLFAAGLVLYGSG